MKQLMGFICFLIVLSYSIPAFAKESYDYNNPEFKATVEMLNMEGHSNDPLESCSVKQIYYKEVAEMFFTKGMSKEEILDYYVKEQGEQALNAPHMSGFNLSLWITPFLLLFGSAIVIFLVIKKWKGNQTHFSNEEDSNKNTTYIDQDIYIAMIEKERKKFL